MSEFKIKFRGVRGSYPVAKKNFLEYGGNTSCIEVNAGGHLIILDAGTGLIDCGNELMEKYITSGVSQQERTPIKATVLISHIHQDHIQGFTFFRPLHVPSTVLNVFGNANYDESLSDELANLLFGKSFPLDLGDIAGSLNITDINESEGILLKKNSVPVIKRIETPEDEKIGKDDVLITFYRSYAHPQEGVLIYKIRYRDKVLVYGANKKSGNISVIEVCNSPQDAEKFCESWGWSFDDGREDYYMMIEEPDNKMFRVDVFGGDHKKAYFDTPEEAREYGKHKAIKGNVVFLLQHVFDGKYDVVDEIK